MRGNEYYGDFSTCVMLDASTASPVPTFGHEKAYSAWAMRQSNKSPKTISRLIDRLEAAREELLKIQRSLEELEAVSESLTGPGKIVSRRKLILPVPRD